MRARWKALCVLGADDAMWESQFRASIKRLLLARIAGGYKRGVMGGAVGAGIVQHGSKTERVFGKAAL